MSLPWPFIPPTRWTFRKQLLTFFLSSVLLLSLTTTLITAWQASELVRKTSIEEGLQLTGSLAAQSVLALLTKSPENATAAVDNIFRFSHVVSIALYTNDRELLLGRHRTLGAQAPPQPDTAPQRPTLSGETARAWYFTAPVVFQGAESTELSALGESLEEWIGYVVLELEKANLHALQRTIFLNNLSIGLLLTLLLAALMSWFIQQMTEPLSSLSQVMDHTAGSGVYQRADINGSYELVRIATSYNQMMDTLEAQRHELQEHRQALEAEVALRTRDLVIARDAALTASRHKSEFLANVSHELRTPLQAIMGYADLAREELELSGDYEQVDDLNKITRSAEHLLALINNVLDLAKIEAGKMDVHLRPTRVADIVQEAVDTIHPMLGVNHNRLHCDVQAMPGDYWLDSQKVLQIVLNLLSNACKFTRKGLITLKVFSRDHGVVFEVSDTGVGIPADQLSRIYDKFHQVDGSQTRQNEGTGLGLAIALNFCQLMNGSLNVVSEQGKGACFTCWLPLAEPNAG